MKNTLPSVLLGVVAGAACLLALGLPDDAGAQPKMRGKRDISGPWNVYPHSTFFDQSVAPGQPQKVQLNPEYEAPYKAAMAAMAKAEAEHAPLANRVTQCMPSGMPTVMGAVFPMEIVPTAKVIYILLEGNDPPRRIFMDGRKIPDLDELEPSYSGMSVGRWEGDTLVVETAGVKTAAPVAGIPHSELMRVTERIHLVDDDTLTNEITITDPKAFKAPWVVKKVYKDYDVDIPGGPGKHPAHEGFSIESGEFICNENNRNLPDANGIVGVQLPPSR